MKKRFCMYLILSVAIVFYGFGNGKSEAGASKSEEPVELSIWHYFEHEAVALEKIAAAFSELKPNVNLVATYISREELMKQYTIGAVSGKLPDVGMVDSPDHASFISLGVFEDITDELKEWGQLDQFYEGPLSSCMDSEGRIYGLPNNSNCLALTCNMDLLNAAGFTEPPQTWDEFYAVAKATTDPADMVYGFAMSAKSNEEGTFQMIPWLYAGGGTFSTLASPASASSLEFLTKLVNEGYMSKEVVNWGQGDAFNAFIAGKAAMVESGTWQLSSIDEDIAGAFNYEYAYLPKDKRYATVIGGENFGVCVGSKDRATSIEFLTYLQTAENNADWCEIAGKLPVRKDASQLKVIWTDDPRFAVFASAMEYSVARGPHEEWPTISKALYTSLQASLIGEKTPAKAMADAAAVVNPILAEKPIAGN